jgi:hypothetical protein
MVDSNKTTSKKSPKTRSPAAKSRKTASATKSSVEPTIGKVRPEEVAEDNNLDIKEFLKQKASTDNDDEKYTIQLEKIKSAFQGQLDNFLEQVSDSKSAFLSFKDNLDETLTGSQDVIARQRKLIWILLATVGVSILMSLILTVISIYNLSSKASDFDIVTAALANRITTMNSGLDEFEQVGLEISNLYSTIDQLAMDVEKNITEIENFRDEIKNNLQESVDDTSDEYLRQSANLRDNFSRLEDRFSGVSSRILNLESIVESNSLDNERFYRELEGIESLKNQVDALLTLEKEKYFEQLQRLQEGGAGENLPNFSVNLENN